MAGNSFGELFRVTTFGESHGPALGGVIDGCPPGLALSVSAIQHELDRRRPGQSKFTTSRREPDEVEILSGVFDGRTTGTPIGFVIRNTDQHSNDYQNIASRYRPGHADYTYDQKYGFRDYRGGGRSSARETAARVVAGAVAKQYLYETFGIKIQGYLSQLGQMRPEQIDLEEVEQNPLFWPCRTSLDSVEAYLTEIRRAGDSIGAAVALIADGVPVGWGEPVFSRLDADIASALMGINAVKGVEIGDGFDCITQRGSEHRDELTPEGFCSNHSGGILGGISSGQQLRIRIALKPTSSIGLAGRTIDQNGHATEVITKGRHDPCVGIRAVPIAEAMLAIVLMDHALRHRAQNASVVPPFPPIPAGR